MRSSARRVTSRPARWPRRTASSRCATVLPAGIGAARAPAASEEDGVSEVDRLEAAAGECREMIREAHAATKDLRTAVRGRAGPGPHRAWPAAKTRVGAGAA